MGSSATKAVTTCVYGPYKILVFGLIGAGKSTVLKNLDLGDVTTITHAGGQMSEMLKYSIYKFVTWDLEGPELKMEELPKNFLKKTDGVIFVVDKSSDEHVKNARKALHTLMNQKEMQNTVLLVLGNKEDLPEDAVEHIGVGYRLHLQSLKQSYHVQNCNASTGDGLFEAMHWLMPVMQERKFLLPWQKAERRY